MSSIWVMELPDTYLAPKAAFWFVSSGMGC
jgi:hypothetical protein